MLFSKGDKVIVTKGRDAGASGKVFWTGTTKGSGKPRYGVRPADGGEAIWAAEYELKLDVAPAPAAAPPAPSDFEARLAALEATVKLLTLALAAAAPPAAVAAPALPPLPVLDARYTVEDLREIEAENAGIDAEMDAERAYSLLDLAARLEA